MFQKKVMQRLAFAFLWIAVSSAACDAAAEKPAPPTSRPVKPEAAGQVLLSNLNCTACHAPSAAQMKWLSPKAAPLLAEIGSRASAEWIARFVASPHETLPGTSMPNVLSDLPPQERVAAAESLTHYLLSVSPPKFRRVMPDKAAVARGDALYHRIGCVACHAPQGVPTVPASANPLPRLADKWGFDGLRRFLRDPLASRPAGRMPAMGLTDAEAADISHYLLRETRVASPLQVAQYRGRVRSLENLDSAELARTGPAEGFLLASMGRDRGYALRFTGWLRVEQAGDYTFYLKSTGSSRLSIQGKWLLGEESWQPEKVDEKKSLHLDAGWHAIAVDYVQRGAKEPALAVEWEGPGVTREIMSSKRLQSEREAVAETVPFKLDAEKAAKGRILFTQRNCVACHESKLTANPAPAINGLQPAQGCLAEQPSDKVPDFHLANGQRDALRSALNALQRVDIKPPSPEERLTHTMAVFQCSVCHSRDGTGGVSPERDAFFTSSGEDLGEEGRLPPHLDAVGNKLRPEWLAEVLKHGSGVRPYLNTRMPQFGEANVVHLADLFVALDRQPRPVVQAADKPDIQREAGRTLTGTDGLSCIACHRFNRQPAQTMQIIDLTTTAERLNEDWFRQFLLDPNRFHPGTRMPAFWPEGKSLLPTVLNGDSDRQQAALWTYYADGGRAKFPEGLSRQNVELAVGGEAVVYRGKLWEAGFRAVAVGYPGQVNAAFDAEEMRLSLLWRGRFLNAGAHWGVQGMGQIRPLGTDVAIFPHGVPLAILADPTQPWPAETSKALGMKFGGYQLDALKRPTLLYSLGKMSVEDFLTPIEGGERVGVRRTMKFKDPPPDGLYLRLAVGKLTPVGDKSWRLDGALTLTVPGGFAFVRGKGDQQELLVPVRVTKTPGQLEVEYVW